jgi:poly(A) polymerase
MSGEITLAKVGSISPEWLSWPETDKIFSAIEAYKGTVRFVGGCVRDALLGLTSEDIDLCTDLLPGDVETALAGVADKVIRTGIEHGTLTVVIAERVFEVTTLRIDTKSHGRHADVAYTKDWISDALRRDFTINALYMDRDGTLLDPVDGLQDLQAGRVRFIGNATERIQEDYLRILRYFRFFARFEKADPDRTALEACRQNKDRLTHLSAERIRKEFVLLLGSENPAPTIELMDQWEILEKITGSKNELKLLRKLLALPVMSDILQRFVALFGGTGSEVERCAVSLKFSNRQIDRLKLMCAKNVHKEMERQKQKEVLYRIGPVAFKDQTILLWASLGIDMDFSAYLGLADSWKRPEFPVSGKDLFLCGISEGPEMGELLAKMEEYWIASGFTHTRDQLLDHFIPKPS